MKHPITPGILALAVLNIPPTQAGRLRRAELDAQKQAEDRLWRDRALAARIARTERKLATGQWQERIIDAEVMP